MKAELVPENGDPPIPITRDVTVLGRRDYCDVVIDHPSLSKRHAVLVKTDGLLVVRDLATTNGTKVKGQRIRWAALLPDDRLAFGAYKVRIYLGPDHAPSPSEKAVAAGAKRPGRPAPAAESDPKTPVSLPVGAPPPAWTAPEPDDSSDDDSGWRKLLPRGNADDDALIELD